MIPNPSKIRHIFFDLDHTLWDFEENAKICLAQIYRTHQVEQMGVVDFHRFFSTFSEVNKAFWYLLDTKKITHEELRKERFRSTFSDLGVSISTETSEAMNQQFLSLLPFQSLLIPNAKLLLEALSPHFQLHILSNGYQQVQRQKLASGGILDFFEHVITNDMAQAHKPSPAMFTYAFITANCAPDEAVMVGDNWLADIEGAMQMGMPAIHFDPNQNACQEPQFCRVSSLLQIPELLLL
ncbi:MAG: YjjG family noncanonical pyrimidine nucleotidase [Spirosomataceae bacterium]